ncbi:MAG TPA: hypothetical protein VHW95_14340 [Steroidobacteraceae bacterium]|jgi:hypothetical protein|nr:hypothetical protein [Steroidobacteraceae bacterium]
MLRVIVIAVGAILTCAGAVLIACGVHAPGWQALAIGVIVLIGTLFERWRYRRIEKPLKGNWERTEEQFIDPSSGQPVEVMFDPRTGERRYVAGRPRDTQESGSE